MFFDHVHFTFEGNYLLARVILDHVETALPHLRGTAQVEPGALQRGMRARPADDSLGRVPVAGADAGDGVARSVLEPVGPYRPDIGNEGESREPPQAGRQARGPSGCSPAYETALEKAPDDWSLHYYYGKLLLGAGESEPAAHHMYIALKAYPWHLPLHIDLANAEMKNGRDKEAIALLQKALEINPDYAVAHADLVSALAGQGRIGEATAHFRKAVEIDPSDYDAYINMGIALGDQGDIEGAMAHFRKALEINPGESSALPQSRHGPGQPRTHR